MIAPPPRPPRSPSRKTPPHPSTRSHSNPRTPPNSPDRIRQLVEANLGLVKYCVLRLQKRLGGLNATEFEDCISDGFLALVNSARQFNAARGFTFGTYACRAIFREVTKQRRRRLRPAVSLSQLTAADKPLIHLIPAPDIRPDHADLETRELSDLLLSVPLPDRQRQVLTLYFFQGWTMAQISEVLGLSKQRIDQIQKSALENLRSSAFICGFNDTSADPAKEPGEAAQGCAGTDSGEGMDSHRTTGVPPVSPIPINPTPRPRRRKDPSEQTANT